MWKIDTTKKVFSSYPFEVEELTIKTNDVPRSHPYYRLNCGDWVNVLPITRDGKAVLIKQFRAGSGKIVLETPGGMVEPNERDVTMTAVRELEEETGLTSMRVLPLGGINPNPAIMTNKCHFFLALDCVPVSSRKHFPDTEEDIELSIHEIKDLESLIRFGSIDHSLAALCIFLALRYLKVEEKNS